MTAEQRANAGAALLDAQVPDWLERINLETLDIASYKCVLCQLYRTYGAGVVALGLTGPNGPGGYPYGFSTRFDGSQDACVEDAKALTEAWKNLIAVRRAA